MLDIYQRMKESVGVSTDTELTKVLNLSNPSAVSMWRKRNRKPYPECEQISQKYNISLDWLLTGNGDKYINHKTALESTTDNNEISYSNIPIYDINASAGSGSFVENEEQKGLLSLSDTYLRNELNINPKDAIMIFVTGDSMEPTLRSGEPILIDKSIHNIISDGIYVLRVDDVVHVKRIQKNIDGSIEVISDNPAYKAFLINKTSNVDINIIGRVVLNIKKM